MQSHGFQTPRKKFFPSNWLFYPRSVLSVTLSRAAFSDTKQGLLKASSPFQGSRTCVRDLGDFPPLTAFGGPCKKWGRKKGHPETFVLLFTFCLAWQIFFLKFFCENEHFFGVGLFYCTKATKAVHKGCSCLFSRTRLMMMMVFLWWQIIINVTFSRSHPLFRTDFIDAFFLRWVRPLKAVSAGLFPKTDVSLSTEVTPAKEAEERKKSLSHHKVVSRGRKISIFYTGLFFKAFFPSFLNFSQKASRHLLCGRPRWAFHRYLNAFFTSLGKKSIKDAVESEIKSLNENLR